MSSLALCPQPPHSAHATAPLCTRNRPTPRSPTPFTHPGLTHACGADSPFPLGASSRVLPSAWMALLHPIPSWPGHSLPPTPACPPPPGRPPTSSGHLLQLLGVPRDKHDLLPRQGGRHGEPRSPRGPRKPLHLELQALPVAAEGDGLACEPGKGSFGIPTRASHGDDSLSALGTDRPLWAPGVLAQMPRGAEFPFSG